MAEFLRKYRAPDCVCRQNSRLFIGGAGLFFYSALICILFLFLSYCLTSTGRQNDSSRRPPRCDSAAEFRLNKLDIRHKTPVCRPRWFARVGVCFPLLLVVQRKNFLLGIENLSKHLIYSVRGWGVAASLPAAVNMPWWQHGLARPGTAINDSVAISFWLNSTCCMLSKGIKLRGKLSYDALKVSDKTDDTFGIINEMKVSQYVLSFFVPIRDSLKSLELQEKAKSAFIYAQVRSYYTLLLMKGYDQKEIFEKLCEWFMTNTGITERDKAEVLVSYFIQNCEVFSEC